MLSYLKESLQASCPYKTNSFKVQYKLDANEAPWDLTFENKASLLEELINSTSFNLYPDSQAQALKEALAKHHQLKQTEGILVGNGSNELIQMLALAFLDKGEFALMPTPTFSMYKQCVQLVGGQALEVPLKEDFSYNIELFKEAIKKEKIKLIFLCTPNNPTGNPLPLSKIKEILDSFQGPVLVDEAYGEFSQASSAKTLLEEYPNLIILKTFSKAFALAGLRLGYCLTSQELAQILLKAKAPYNVNSFSQRAALIALKNFPSLEKELEIIKKERVFMSQALGQLPGVTVYPSESNFLLFRVKQAQSIWQKLLAEGFLVRDFSQDKYLTDCLRLTIADRATNIKFLESLEKILKSEAD